MLSDSSNNMQMGIDKWQKENPQFVIHNATMLNSGSNFYMTIIYDDGTLPKFKSITKK